MLIVFIHNPERSSALKAPKKIVSLQKAPPSAAIHLIHSNHFREMEKTLLEKQ